MNPQDYEKLGLFYLGRLLDPSSGAATETPLLYDARDLVTHGVCVGMTGSGKTGLCIDLLEEAAIDGIPAIAIDPKGDLGNMLLTFPDLEASDFRPWIDEEEARRKGLEPDAFAAEEATRWREGLAAWRQDGERIRRLRESVELTIYTPGSTAGRPISVLRSLAAPPAPLREDAELLADRIGGAVGGLLGLMDIEADPLTSREHVFLSTLLDHEWRAGRDLDLAGIIRAIQEPPMRQVGLVDVEAFFPKKERFELAMRVNALVAAPGFRTWLEGEPLDVGALLWNPEGKPRISIISIAHLSEAERLFVVALLLNEILAWTRTQAGTSSLRAIIYMDEIFGYFPPVAEPPTKRPLLTLLKQARAHGVGILLATQNPVDLDYKGLSNAGTWFIGRLQTERDKARLLDGLEGVTGGTGFDRAEAERTIASLKKRAFLLHDVHESGPVVFETRWAMSYLRGPLTRVEIARLTEGTKDIAGTAAPAAPPAEGVVVPPTEIPAAAATAPPVAPPDIGQVFVPARGAGPFVWRPHVLALGVFDVADRKRDIRASERRLVVAPMVEGAETVDWGAARALAVEEADLAGAPSAPGRYESPPSAALQPRRWSTFRKAAIDWIYRNSALTLFRSEALDAVSQPGEGEREFRIRLQQLARERRDEEATKLRRRYEPKLARLAERVRKAEQAVARESQQSQERKTQTAISLGATVLGSMFGRRSSAIGRATTAARDVGRAMRQRGDVARARESLAAAQAELTQLDSEFQAELNTLAVRHDPATEPLGSVEIRPTRAGVTVSTVALGWLPFSEGGEPEW